MYKQTQMSLAVALLGAAALAQAAESVEQQMAPFDCFIEPNMVVDVSSPDEGIIKQLDVGKSDSVQPGQVLFTLDSALESATLKLAEARARMSDEIRARKTSLAHSQRKMERIGQLYNRQAVPLHQKDEVETEVALARLQLQQARENRQLAKLDAERARTLLERRQVASPISGVVVQRFKFPGEYVEGEPVMRLAQLDPLRVEVIVPVRLFGRIQPGMKARVLPEINPAQQTYQAQVIVVDPVADVSSGTFGVRLELPNPELKLPSGLKCNVQFAMPDQPGDSGTVSSL
ncbi:efflux RND transporter periplasmic adaptor subunit [Marinobacterium arenosum]|uniref:efflux RND transporter periplasmic adaptor subunit n=1 Tax=Marinobacterium arenosum TaxID=2862496 RepID=UPI001C9709DF|nr:efflux RND transporter periplasmic adaptor subunit [Marinobacterium arenosum]MBY4677529.1 efflux RND transporter periplasmic adaptor subunit [Marinobacterium arenosum]